MIESTAGQRIIRPERSRLDLFLEQTLKAMPIYLFAQGLGAAIKNLRR